LFEFFVIFSQAWARPDVLLPQPLFLRFGQLVMDQFRKQQQVWEEDGQHDNHDKNNDEADKSGFFGEPLEFLEKCF
jgi:hypothetical protein